MKTPAFESSHNDGEPAHGTPFGEQNRRRLIADFFKGNGALTAQDAWKGVYGLLLWVDRSIGLAHCYESDKCQPGRPWYGRTLAFHKWLAQEFGSVPIGLGKNLDGLFQAALAEYLRVLASKQSNAKEKGDAQRAAVGGDFPLPGADPEIERLISGALKPYFSVQPPNEVFDAVAEQLREYWRQENKRKNLLGEGFEDVLAAIVNATVGGGMTARTRTSIADLPGFSAPGARDKATKVDLVLSRPGEARPILANVKWSFRSDREDQLWDDFKEYVRFDRDHRGFDHYLVTNEFDPARLNAVCDRREANSFVFRRVVHINTDGVLAAYTRPVLTPAGAEPVKSEELSSMARVQQQIQQGRLVSLSVWLNELASCG